MREALPAESPVHIWGVVQKLPGLLDDVHDLMEDPDLDLKFCLTGSSVRKLKASGANLLAGRAFDTSRIQTLDPCQCRQSLFFDGTIKVTHIDLVIC
jgi:hypothetical protein